MGGVVSPSSSTRHQGHWAGAWSSGSWGHLGPPHMLLSCLQIDLYAGALFVHICLGWNFYLSTIIMLAITALYTIAGAAPGDTQETGRLAGGGSGHLLP